MKVMLIAGIAAVALGIAARTNACEPGVLSVNGADGVFVGYVTGERWPDMEDEYLKGDSAAAKGNRRGYPLLLLRVVRTESLKGSSPDIVEAISPCALPVPAGEKVFVSRNGNEYVSFPAKLYPDGGAGLRKELGH